MNKAYLDNVLDNSVHFSEHSCAWKIILPMLLVDKFVLDTSDAKLAKLGLQRSDSDVLASLFFNNNLLSPTQLYEAMLFSSGGMTKVLKRLEMKGLISRIPSTDDRRSLLVKLEEKGEILIRNVISLSCSASSTKRKNGSLKKRSRNWPMLFSWMRHRDCIYCACDCQPPPRALYRVI